MIIIETPAPPTRERLVLVPVGETHAHCRDATPEDLARAGYVLLVGYLPRREVETAVSDAMDLQRRLIEAEGHAAELALERDDAIARAEKAERERDDANLTSETWERAAKVVERERNEARTALGRVAIERDEARRLHSAAEAQIECRNELRARLAQAERELDEARAELARLTAPVEGEPTEDALRAVWILEAAARGEDVGPAVSRRALYRLGVAHERARQPAQDRATDEELADLYAREYDAQAHQTRDTFSKSHNDCRRAGILAVAARVRGERCLVARAVGDQLIDSVSIDRVTGGRIRVRVVRRRDPIANPDGESVEAFCKRRSDVPATLARLLGEVSRG